LTGSSCVAVAAGTTTTTNPAPATCFDGYSLVSSICIKCPTGAKTCTTTTAASTCLTGYDIFATGNTCIKLDVGATAGTIPKALSCADGYYLD
jgi:hypothetical protein